jgi:hypothetical protein
MRLGLTLIFYAQKSHASYGPIEYFYFRMKTLIPPREISPESPEYKQIFCTKDKRVVHSQKFRLYIITSSLRNNLKKKPAL